MARTQAGGLLHALMQRERERKGEGDGGREGEGEGERVLFVCLLLSTRMHAADNWGRRHQEDELIHSFQLGLPLHVPDMSN